MNDQSLSFASFLWPNKNVVIVVTWKMTTAGMNYAPTLSKKSIHLNGIWDFYESYLNLTSMDVICQHLRK